jgi:hypothetical protein
MGDHTLRSRCAHKRRPTGQALIQHARQRVYVHPAIGLDLGADLLRRHVGDGADGLAESGQRTVVGGVGDPEVDQGGELVVAQQDVGGFDIAVDKPGVMGRL